MKTKLFVLLICSFIFCGCPKLSPSQFSLIPVQASEAVLIGSSVRYQLNASGPPQAKGTATFSVSGLPDGATATVSPASLNHPGAVFVTVNAATAAPGTYTFRVAGSAAGQSVATSLTLTITVAPATLVVATTSLPGAQVGVSYSVQLQASGGTPPYTWSMASGSLPAGLTLSSSGVISGTPLTAGSASFTVQCTDSGAPTPQAVRFSVSYPKTSKGT